MSVAPQHAVVLDAEQTLRLPLAGVKLIEASAGTGKTYAISNLYLRYVLDGFQVNQILVVTFTNAATEELRGRIRKRLHEAQRLLEALATGTGATDDAFLQCLLLHFKSVDETLLGSAVSRLRFAVRSMEEAAIFTINGFCQRALTDHAFNSGQPFALELIKDDDELWQEALKDWWRRTVYPLDAERLALCSRVFPRLQSFIKAQAVLRTAAEKRLLPALPDALEAVFEQWHRMATALQTLREMWHHQNERACEILINSKVLSRSATSGYRHAELHPALQILSDYFAQDAWYNVPTELRLLSARHLFDNSKPAQRGTDPQLEEPFFVQSARVCEEWERIQELFRLVAIQRATEAARAQMESQKARTGTMSYQDQLTRLRDALAAEGGDALASVLRQSFPVAMIDEFQDTDGLQYEIFRRLYLPAQFGMAVSESLASALAMIMIGDPKQAIYSFRGGDIFAYAKARHDVGSQLYTLATNWRSVPPLVHAVNQVFKSREAPFVYADIIDFQEVVAAPKSHHLLTVDGEQKSALTFWQFGLDEGSGANNKSELVEQICDAVADEIATLIVAGRTGAACLGDEPLVPGDIAVLVRSRFEGQRVRQALQLRGFDAVTVGRDTVFESAEAQALYILLEAVVHYQDRQRLRAALSSELLGFDYLAIAAIVENPQAWLAWAEQLREINLLWSQRGFMAAFYTLLQRLQIGMRLAEQSDADRRLTNVLHLGELLQQTSKKLPGFESLLSWLHEQLQDNEDDETQLRLESDEALVKIVTIHASKGLEYPVVFVPFLWSSKPTGRYQSGNQNLSFHDANGDAVIALEKEAIAANLYTAEKERLAEDVRLAYVALTRARAKLYCVWGAPGGRSKAKSESSALAWLLSSQQSTEDLTTNVPFTQINTAIVNTALTALCDRAKGAIDLAPLPNAKVPVRIRSNDAASYPLNPRQFQGRIAIDWRINSFSSLTRDVHQPPIARGDASSGDAIMQFMAGSQVGLFLHDILEHLDFSGDVLQQADNLNVKFSKKYGFVPEQHAGVVRQWLDNIVHTQLDDSGLSLATIENRRRLNELEFDLGINHVDVQALNHFLSQWAGVPLTPLEVENFRGMITGFIDLVFEHQGRFYIADYKSNLLGMSLSDYRSDALKQAMLERRYDLQYLLYIVALHRYLQQRVPHYHYEQHMGGAYYLFLRGMRPAHGPRYGVYFDLPAFSVIDALDREVFGTSNQQEVLR